MNKYLALQKDVFDINKVTVVGSPTITSDGVASGFDNANANNIQIPTAIISQIATANTWKVKVSGTVQESGFTYGNIRTDNNIRYDLIQINRYANGFMFVCCLDENGTATSKNIPITFSNTYNGKAYKATLEFTGTKYIATVQFGDGEVLTNSLNSTYKIKFFNYGDNFELGYKCNNGSINLPSFKIYVDVQLVFQPVKPTYLLERRKEGYDPSKFTVVGTPIITEYGVASGFTVGSYVNVPILDLSSGDFEVETTFNFIPMSQTQIIYRCATNNYGGAFGFLIATTSANKFYLSGSDRDIVTNITLTQATYKAKLKIKNQIAYVYLNDDLVIETPFTKSITNGYLSFGYGAPASLFAGSIDLPSVSITADGKEVFTGAKENYYMLRR